MKKKRIIKKETIVSFLIVAAILGFLLCIPYVFLTGHQEVEILSKERVDPKPSHSKKDSPSQYIVYTKQGPFKVTDTWWYLHFKASNVYGEMNEGKKYDVKTFGMRIPFFTMYKNIIKVKPLDPDEIKNWVEEDGGLSLFKKWLTVNITHKERVDGTYMIYTNRGPFELTDTFLFWRWNTSNVYGKIQPGTYKISVWGWRSGYWSLYKNIIDIDPIPEPN